MSGIGDWWNDVTSGKIWNQNMAAANDFWTKGGGKGIHDFFLGQQAEAPAERPVDFGQSNEDRGNQMRLLAQLQAMAAGQGPSLAQGQLQQATDQNIRQAMALGQAQQGQGMGYASALRNIADQSAAARQQAAAQSAMIRNAEQMQAMQGQASLLGGMRGQDLGQAGLGADQGYRHDALKANVDMQNANHGVLPSVLNAAGSLMSMGLGSASQGQQAAAPGFMSGASKPVLDGGMRTYNPPSGDWTIPDPSGVAHASRGGQVPGYAMGGQMDSRKNDTVPAMLSPGEIVIPRSITMAPNAGELSRMFVEEIQRRRKDGPSSSEHAAVVAARLHREREERQMSARGRGKAA